jgi:phosphate starvation-inducible membrane PsiE
VTVLLFSSVIILQVLTIYLDNKTNMFDFFNRVRQGSIATAYTNRGITLTVARTIFYVVPPLLGFLILNTSQNEFEILIISVAIINFLVTVCQCFFFTAQDLIKV